MSELTRVIVGDGLTLRSDGRTVDGCIVPYDTPTDVVEAHKVTGELISYREQFMARSCQAMAQHVARRGNGAFIPLLMEHEEDSWDAKIGYVTHLKDERDGAYATFRLYEGKDLEKVQSMLRESHKGLSVAFKDVKPPRIIDDVVSRVQVLIGHVAATPSPAYAGAAIMSMREGEDEGLIIAGTPKLDELYEWLATVGAAHRE